MLRDHPNLNFEPGSKYGYSNIAYWLLEKALEAVSGQSFVNYVREHIFGPLLIQPADASFILSPHDLATGHIQKYSLSNFLFYLISPSAYWLESAHGWSRFARMHHLGFGYGGLYCSTGAFGTILQDLIQEKSNILLKPETKELFFSPQQTTCGETIQGTLGWAIGKVDGFRTIVNPEDLFPWKRSSTNVECGNLFLPTLRSHQGRFGLDGCSTRPLFRKHWRFVLHASLVYPCVSLVVTSEILQMKWNIEVRAFLKATCILHPQATLSSTIPGPYF
jgi:hypothetical protein